MQTGIGIRMGMGIKVTGSVTLGYVKSYLCIALYYELFISRRSGMARVNEGSQFYLPPTLLSTG